MRNYHMGGDSTYHAGAIVWVCRIVPPTCYGLCAMAPETSVKVQVSSLLVNVG